MMNGPANKCKTCSTKPNVRRDAIPILYTRGSHYEVGFNMGRTFGSMIRNFQTQCQILNQSLLPLYNTPKGKQIYDETLASVKASFPQYVRELQGVADGAEVEFEHLFLRQMDEILPKNMMCPAAKKACGCSSIILNQKHCRLVGHTEDAVIETMNHYYFVVAHIISDQPQGKYKVKEERFMSLCYAGLLPGHTCSQNHHGLVFTVNTIAAKNLRSGRTPGSFITRALLASCNMDDVLRVVIDDGVGAADACSINLTFLNDPRKMCYNMEFAPCPQGKNKSKVCVKEIPVGTYNYHFNKFEGLSLEETDEKLLQSSEARKETMKSYKPPVSASDVRNMLGDVSGDTFNVWMDKCTDILKTICVALFDLNDRTLSLYSGNPSCTEPVCILPMLEKK